MTAMTCAAHGRGCVSDDCPWWQTRILNAEGNQ